MPNQIANAGLAIDRGARRLQCGDVAIDGSGGDFQRFGQILGAHGTRRRAQQLDDFKKPDWSGTWALSFAADTVAQPPDKGVSAVIARSGKKGDLAMSYYDHAVLMVLLKQGPLE